MSRYLRVVHGNENELHDPTNHDWSHVDGDCGGSVASSLDWQLRQVIDAAIVAVLRDREWPVQKAPGQGTGAGSGELALHTYEDLLQESVAMLADCRRNLREAWDSRDLGLLYTRLEQDLRDVTKTELRRQDKTAAILDREREESEKARQDGRKARERVRVTIQAASPAYTRETLTALMPAISGVLAPEDVKSTTAPDADMPRGTRDYTLGTSVIDHIIDIRRAWESADLGHDQRAALFLRYGHDMTLRDAAAIMGCSHEHVRGAAEEGLQALSRYLNGGDLLTLTGLREAAEQAAAATPMERVA